MKDLSTQEQSALDAAYALQCARDSLKAFYWSESDHRRSIHFDQAMKELRTAASSLGFDLVETSKQEAA